MLRELEIDGIIDVGANRGQFTLACRIALTHIPILAFEPIPNEADIFSAIHGQDSSIDLVRCALGEASSQSVLHLSKCYDSSSLLPIGRRQTELYPHTAEKGTLVVSVQALDDYLHLMAGRKNQLLKLDVQGYELNVLKGSSGTLATCKYVYAECSEVPLYDGQALRPEVADFLQAFGFRQTGSFNLQFQGSELIQADYLFSRE
jgi:FkbM family methyltransferase